MFIDDLLCSSYFHVVLSLEVENRLSTHLIVHAGERRLGLVSFGGPGGEFPDDGAGQ